MHPTSSDTRAVAVINASAAVTLLNRDLKNSGSERDLNPRPLCDAVAVLLGPSIVKSEIDFVH